MKIYDLTSENGNTSDEPIVTEKGSNGNCWCGPLGAGPGIAVP